MLDERTISGVSVFVAVARAGSYEAAGRLVGLTRSGVGKAITRLEDRIGFRLLDRSNRAVRVTNEGRMFLDEVVPCLERMGRAIDDARLDPATLRGRLRVSADAAFATFLLLPRLDEFVGRHPNLVLEVVVRDRIDGDLLIGGYDLAVRFGRADGPDLGQAPILEARVVTCASAAYVARRGAPTTPDDLLDPRHRCIGLADATTGRTHRWDLAASDASHRPVTPPTPIVVNDAPALKSAVSAHLGIGRVLDFMVEAELADGRLVEVLPAWNTTRWPAYVWTRAGASNSRAVQAFAEFCRSVVPRAAPRAGPAG